MKVIETGYGTLLFVNTDPHTTHVYWDNNTGIDEMVGEIREVAGGWKYQADTFPSIPADAGVFGCLGGPFASRYNAIKDFTRQWSNYKNPVELGQEVYIFKSGDPVRIKPGVNVWPSFIGMVGRVKYIDRAGYVVATFPAAPVEHQTGLFLPEEIEIVPA